MDPSQARPVAITDRLFHFVCPVAHKSRRQFGLRQGAARFGAAGLHIVRAALIQINGWPTPLRSHARLGLWGTDMMAQRTVVIVVDDDPGLLKSVARLLAHHGIDSRTFSSAEALLESESVQKATCLLLDTHLGGIFGD
jgi:hypothetical protein